VLWSCFLLLPLLLVSVLSLFDWNLSRSATPVFSGLNNYARMLSDPEVLGAVGRTLLFTVESVVLQLVLGLGIALLFVRHSPVMGVVRTLFLAPMMVAPIFAAMVWRLLYSDDFGLLRYALLALGVEDPPSWLGDPAVALHAVVLVNVWQWTAFVVLFLLAALQSIPAELYEAARMDGAGAWRRFRFITLPLLRPAILAVALFRAVDAVKVLDIVYVLTAGGPGTSTQLVSFLVYRTGLGFFDLGYASAQALLVLVLILLLVAGLLLPGRARR
jgi:ABC-type sugar transport system permease subunit